MINDIFTLLHVVSSETRNGKYRNPRAYVNYTHTWMYDRFLQSCRYFSLRRFTSSAMMMLKQRKGYPVTHSRPSRHMFRQNGFTDYYVIAASFKFSPSLPPPSLNPLFLFLSPCRILFPLRFFAQTRSH